MCLAHNNLFLFDSEAYVHWIVYYFQQNTSVTSMADPGPAPPPSPPFEKKGLDFVNFHRTQILWL